MKKVGVIIAASIAVIAGIVAIFVVGFMLRWGSAAAEVAGPQNVSQQYKKAYDLASGLDPMESRIESKQREIKEFKKMYGEPQTWSRTQQQQFSQKRSKVTAMQSQYDSIVQKYNSQMSNAWEGKLVGPTDLPDQLHAWQDHEKNPDLKPLDLE